MASPNDGDLLAKAEETQNTVNNNEEYQRQLEELEQQNAKEQCFEGLNLLPRRTFMEISEYVKQYEGLSAGVRHEDIEVSLAGRIMSIRQSLNWLFFDLKGDGARVQVMVNTSDMDEAERAKVKSGNIVDVTGFPGKSRTGELSIIPKRLEVLAYCRRMLPDSSNPKNKIPWVPGRARDLQKFTIKDQETRYRQRELDLILHRDVEEIFETRHKIEQYLRTFLLNLNFKEVRTPILNVIPGGAAARPFATHHNELNMPLYLRIAPELYLKRLIVGGLRNVFEIGQQFRNEGIDLTHNPEFTTCEFYMAYKDYYDMMEITETLLSGMVKDITGGYKVQYHANGPNNDPIEIDFTPPFRRFDMIKELEKESNLQIPKDLSSEEANKYLAEACLKFGIKCSTPTTSRLLDKLVGHFLEVKCVNPTFIMNHPECMSPLAKGHRDMPGLTERFELFVNKHELANAYSELTDPDIQSQRFADQFKDRQRGDDEAMMIDASFIAALECGMPPTGGCGLGVDRLAMLLTDSQNIKEVILFPTMKPQAELPAKEMLTGDKIVKSCNGNDRADEVAEDVESATTTTVDVDLQNEAHKLVDAMQFTPELLAKLRRLRDT